MAANVVTAIAAVPFISFVSFYPFLHKKTRCLPAFSGDTSILITVHGFHKRPAYSGAEYSPHRDTLSLREARSGSNAANHAAKEPAGFKGSLWGLYSAPLYAALSAAVNSNHYYRLL